MMVHRRIYGVWISRFFIHHTNYHILSVCFVLFCNRGSSTWLWSDHCVLVRPRQSVGVLRAWKLCRLPYKQCVPLCVKKVLRPQDTRYAPPYKLFLTIIHGKDPSWHLSRNINWIECSDPGWSLESKPTCDVKPYHGKERLATPVSDTHCMLCSPANFASHRWRCRLFLRRGPAQTECATNLDGFFNDPLRIAGLQRMLRRQGTSLWGETSVQV